MNAVEHRRLPVGVALLMMLGAASPLPNGSLSTEGSQIIDKAGHPVRILSVGAFDDVSDKVAAISAAGFNTIRLDWSNRSLKTDAKLRKLDARRRVPAAKILSVGAFDDVSDKIAAISAAGFNTIRLDWSNRSLKTDAKLRKLDKIIVAARQAHLKVILDDHSNESADAAPWKPCFAQQVNGLWYDVGGATDDTDGCQDRGTVTDAQFVEDWKTVAQHYKNEDTVIGYDIWNEPSEYGKSTWEPGARNPTHNIRYMYERVGNAILRIDPTKLIICEGPPTGNALANPRWPAPWGDLSLAGKYPVQLSVDHQLVYSVHDYPREISGSTPDSGPQKVALMNKTWGYLVATGIAPVWIGEMGSDMLTAADAAWAQTMIGYANGHLAADGGPAFAPGAMGIGINWWFAGFDPQGKPTGIFNQDGTINERVRAAYKQFFTDHTID